MRIAKTYFDQARGPTASLYFVAPLLILSMCGVLVLSGTASAELNEDWPRHVSTFLGVAHWLMLPVATILGLVVWSRRSRCRWNVPAYVIAGMWVECLLAAAAWIILAHGSFAEIPTISVGASESSITDVAPSALRQWKIGVEVEKVLIIVREGVSDDVLFRLLMLPALAWLLRGLRQSREVTVVGAIMVSTVFAVAANHFGWLLGVGGSAEWIGCALHAVLLGTLFVYRGFGVTVGTHAIYLVGTGLLLNG